MGIKQLFKSMAFAFALLLFSGCATEPRPQIIVKEVKIPVICPVKMPKKPENSGDFESHKALMIYFLECEALLKHCTSGLTSRRVEVSPASGTRGVPAPPEVTMLRAQHVFSSFKRGAQ